MWSVLQYFLPLHPTRNGWGSTCITATYKTMAFTCYIKLYLLSVNGLTTLSSFVISDITIKCKVKKLVISSNDTIGENEQLCSILSSPSTMLEELQIGYTKLSTRGAIALLTALKDNNKLKMLYIARNTITDDVCGAITAALEKNNCLVRLATC